MVRKVSFDFGNQIQHIPPGLHTTHGGWLQEWQYDEQLTLLGENLAKSQWIDALTFLRFSEKEQNRHTGKIVCSSFRY